jgi:hypothetical protein
VADRAQRNKKHFWIFSDISFDVVCIAFHTQISAVDHSPSRVSSLTSHSVNCFYIPQSKKSFALQYIHTYIRPSPLDIYQYKANKSPYCKLFSLSPVYRRAGYFYSFVALSLLSDSGITSSYFWDLLSLLRNAR